MKDSTSCGCGKVPIRGLRMLTFCDGSKSGVIGLSRILEEMWKAGRVPGSDTAKEIVNLLAKENYIPCSAISRYEEAVLREYSAFFKTAKEQF